MGLLAKKKAAIQKAKIEKTHEIVCLYCFRSFNHDQVKFRAKASLDDRGYEDMPDYPLDDYRARFYMGSLGDMPPALDPEDFGEASKGHLRGILSSLKDAYGDVTSQRICPYCHNDISASAGFAPSTVISIVGASQSGKSVFLTSLIHTIKSVTSHNFDVFCAPLSGEMGRKFKFECEDPFIETGQILGHAQISRQQEPFVFTFSFADGTKPELSIAFFDVTADGVTDNANMEIFASYVRNSSGVMFLVEPAQFRAIGLRLQNLNQANVATTQDPAEVLSGMVEKYIYKQQGGVSHIPTAVVLTKTDLLEAISYEGDYIHPRSTVFTRFTHRTHLNMTQTDIVNYEIDEFIQRADPNFRNALKRRFANLGLFGVSARNDIRVDEPFLWILYKLGYIDGFYEGAVL